MWPRRPSRMPTIPSRIACGAVFGEFTYQHGQREAANLAQEFILRRLTPKAKNQN